MRHLVPTCRNSELGRGTLQRAAHSGMHLVATDTGRILGALPLCRLYCFHCDISDVATMCTLLIGQW